MDTAANHWEPGWVPINSTRAVILGLLHEGAATGGEIVATAQRRLAAQGGVTRSQVYRELPFLVERGYIEAIGDAGDKHHSQAYRITDTGRVRFADWAATPIRNDMVRSATVLRLGFGVHLGVERRQQIIAMARAEHELALAEHKQCAKDLRANGDHFAAAAADFAVEYDRAFLAWLDTVPLS